MPLTFDSVGSNSSLDSSYQILSNDIKFVWFHGGPKFAIALSNDVIITPFSYQGVFKLAYLVEHNIGYQPSKF